MRSIFIIGTNDMSLIARRHRWLSAERLLFADSICHIFWIKTWTWVVVGRTFSRKPHLIDTQLLNGVYKLCNGSPTSFHILFMSVLLERFSFECRKVIGFALSTRCDWLKRFAPPFHPIRSKTKANCDALACTFPRFASATCNYFEFWLVQCIVCVLCDWPE